MTQQEQLSEYANAAAQIQRRADELWAQGLDQERRATDRVFFWLLLAQWAFAIFLAMHFSPRAWEGKVSSVHFHVHVAVLFGGLINVLPLTLIIVRPGWVVTRYSVAVVQMLWSALLIHLTGGRIETHFHVFGSLAFLAAYKDWRVLIPATLTIAADHFLRGVFWPVSVYGTMSPEWWRFLEHAGWVLFEDAVLFVACRRGVAAERIVSEREAHLEAEIEQGRVREAELAKARCAAEEASRAKSRFLANMSHEIRTPMNGVLGFTNLLFDSPLTTEQRHHIKTIRDSGEALLQIINDILDFSKIESGRLSVEHIPFDVRAAAEEVADLLTPSAQNKGLTLTCNIDKALPPAVLGDLGRVRQILLNLVGNAIKFTPRGHVSVSVTLRDTRDGPGDVHVAVMDTGVGIPPEKQALLFQEFSQGDASTTRKFGGTGLGLAISKRLVELMGGRIGCTSDVEHGSCFWFTIPARCPAQSAVVPVLDQEYIVHAEPTKTSFRVLVAEDNAVNRMLATKLLEKIGCDVEVACDGVEAVRMATRGHYDLIFMDCFMPNMDGYEATAELRRCLPSEPHVPIVALTASAMLEDRAVCLAAGMDDFLSKPIGVDALRAVVRRWTFERPAAVRPAPVYALSEE
jgi:signal transduction histidine kinase/ActR/RegA family two-component response regulator